MPFLLLLPGIGLYTGMTILAAIGHIERFANPAAIERSFITWSSPHHLKRSQAPLRLDFVKHRLATLGILDQISSFRANGRVHLLAS